MITWIKEPVEYDWTKTHRENKLRSRGIVRCHCGEPVELGPAALPPRYYAACDKCGTLFNLCGQELRPLNEWAEHLE